MLRRIGALAAALTLGPWALAVAQPAGPVTVAQMTMGYTYFNRPAADLKLHDADVADCAGEGARTISLDEQLHNGSTGGLVGGLVGGALQRAYHRGSAASGLENCMVVRGWRVVKLPDDEGKALAALPGTELATRLAPWIGSAEPHGEIVRVWGNDAANAANARYSVRPDHTNDGQLSLTEATSGNLHQFTIPERPADSNRDVMDPKWPKKPLTPADLGSAPEGAAILLVQIKGLGLHNGIAVWLNREGTARDILPSRDDHAPDLLIASKGVLFAKKSGDMFAFAVPAGHWRVWGLGLLPTLNFCLGAPSFPIEPGEVVYAGSFDLSAADIGPDLDLAPAKAWLASRPQSDKVRAAVYTNGSRGLCGSNAIYALEVKGAPFEPGYQWGGALKPLTLAAPAPNSGAAPAAPSASAAATAPPAGTPTP
jgi:hypothetical protein